MQQYEKGYTHINYYCTIVTERRKSYVDLLDFAPRSSVSKEGVASVAHVALSKQSG